MMIFVYPRQTVIDAIARGFDFKDYPIISISGVGNKLTNVNDLNIVQLEFDDDLSSFTEQHAKQIINFVDTNKFKRVMYVHCDAGISRSGAVGLWICRYLGEDENEFRNRNTRIHPNNYIMDVLKRIERKMTGNG